MPRPLLMPHAHPGGRLGARRSTGARATACALWRTPRRVAANAHPCARSRIRPPVPLEFAVRFTGTRWAARTTVGPPIAGSAQRSRQRVDSLRWASHPLPRTHPDRSETPWQLTRPRCARVWRPRPGRSWPGAASGFRTVAGHLRTRTVLEAPTRLPTRRAPSATGRSRLQSEPERSSATRCVRPGSSGRSGPLLTCSAAPGRPRAPSFGTTLKWPPPGSHFAPPRPAGLRAGSPSGLPLPASFAGQHGYRRIGAWSHAIPDRAGPSSTLVVKPSSRLAVPGSGQSYRHASRSRPAPSGASCPALRLREVIRREDRPELSAEPGRGCRPLPRIRFDGSCTSSRWTRVHR